MLKKTNYLLFLLIWTACALPPKSTSEIPDWASGSTLQKAGRVHAIGTDENGRLESLADALFSFSVIVHATIAVNDKQTNSETEYKIGDISISGSTVEMFEEGKGSYSEFIHIISYSKDNASLRIHSSYKETETGKDSQIKRFFEFISENASYPDLVKELENSGIVVKTAYDGKIHYTLLDAPESIIKIINGTNYK